MVRNWFVVLVAAAVSLVAGCDRADSAAPSAQGPATVRVGYFANLTHAQAVLGVSSGEYAAAVAPARLETKVFNAGPSLIEALLADEIDIGYVGPGPAIAGYLTSDGTGLKVVSGAAANGVVIVASSASNVHKLEDLLNARIATPQLANTQDIAARHYASSELKQSSLSNILAIPNAEQSQMMQRGEIDAAWVPEPWGARLMIESGARLIAEEKDLWPDRQFATTVVVATPRFIANHPELLANVLAAHSRWTQKLQSDPQAQLPTLKTSLFALTRKKLPEGTLEQAITRVKYTDDPLLSSILTMAQWTHELNFAKKPAKLDGLLATVPSRPAKGN